MDAGSSFVDLEKTLQEYKDREADLLRQRDEFAKRHEEECAERLRVLKEKEDMQKVHERALRQQGATLQKEIEARRKHEELLQEHMSAAAAAETKLKHMDLKAATEETAASKAREDKLLAQREQKKRSREKLAKEGKVEKRKNLDDMTAAEKKKVRKQWKAAYEKKAQARQAEAGEVSDESS
jgi:hypothetical protein